MSTQLENLYNAIPPERKRRFDYANRIADFLRFKMSRMGITQKKLSEKINMSPSQLNRYMNGEANLNLETIAKLEIAIEDNIILIRQPLASVSHEIKYEEEKNGGNSNELFRLRRDKSRPRLKESYNKQNFNETGS